MTSSCEDIRPNLQEESVKAIRRQTSHLYKEARDGAIQVITKITTSLNPGTHRDAHDLFFLYIQHSFFLVCWSSFVVVHRHWVPLEPV